MKIRTRYLIVLAVVWGPFIALTVAFHLLALKPQMQRVEALEIELADARTLYDQATEAAKEENQRRLTQIVDGLKYRISDFVLRLESAPELAFGIAELASATQVESFAMKPRNQDGLGTVADCDLIGEKQIKVSFAAPFDQFATLLNALERHRPVLFVETFAINRPREEDMQPDVEMQLAVLVEKPHSG